MPIPINIFVSSTMKELEDERELLRNLLQELGDGFVEITPWVFEHDEVARNKPTQQLCREKLEESVLYLGLFWKRYGRYTIEDEHAYALKLGIARHLYVKTVDDVNREKKLQDFINTFTQYEDGVTAKWFDTLDILRESVTEAIDDWLRSWLTRPSGKIPRIFQRDTNDQHNIPDDLLPDNLIGRASLLTDIQTALTTKKRVLLHGFVGTGKTAVAATIAAQQIAQGPVLWVDTGMESYRTVVDRLIEELDGSEEDAPDKEFIERLLIQQNITLIVLDNMWMDGPVLAKLLKTLPAAIPVLVTSRNRYPLKAIIDLGNLAPPDAVQLLNAQADQDYTASPQASALCAQLDHNPFALKVAGEMLRVDQITPGALIELIAEAPHEAHMPDDFASPGRRSLWELLDTSLYLLNDAERLVFRAFGTLTDPDVSPELIDWLVKHLRAAKPDTASADDADIPIRTVLNDLQRRALIKLGADGRYTISGMAHVYTQALIERTHPNGSHHLIAAHACRDFVRATLDDLPAQDHERPHIVKSLTAALATDPASVTDTLLDIIEMMVLSPNAYFLAYPHNELSLTLLEKSAGLAQENERYPLAHELTVELGFILLRYFNRIEKAIDATQQSLDYAQLVPPAERDRAVLKSKIQLASAYGELSDKYFYAGQQLKASGGTSAHQENLERQYATEALNGSREAETIARNTGNNRALCTVLQHQGYFIMRKQDRLPEEEQNWQEYAEAARRFDEMIPIARQLPDLHGLLLQAYSSRIGCDFHLAMLKHDLAYLEHAQETLQAAQALAAADNPTESTEIIETSWEVNYGLARYWFRAAITTGRAQNATAELNALREFLTRANATTQALKSYTAEAFHTYVDTILAQAIDQLLDKLTEQNGTLQTAQAAQENAQLLSVQAALAQAYHALAEFRAAEALNTWRDLDADYMVQDFRNHLVDHFNYSVELKSLPQSTS